MLRKLLFAVSCLGAILLTLLTLAVSILNWGEVTRIWYTIIFGGTGALIVVAVIAAALMKVIRKEICWRPMRVLIIAAGIFLLQLPLHFLFNTAASWTARQYIVSKLPRLETYKQQQGRYPGELGDVLKDENILPVLLCNWWAYSVYNDRSTFKVEVYNPVSNGRYVFDPASHAWKVE